jgi:phosphotransferase system HPr (HPr) family protein
MKVLEQNITVTNRRGVHSRVATGLAMIAREHAVGLQIIHGPHLIDCTSILDVLSMALVCGTRLTVRVQGDGAETEQALAAVQRILTAQDEQ